MQNRTLTLILTVFGLGLLSLGLAACGNDTNAAATTSDMAGHNHPMAPLSDMPELVQQSEARVQEAYRFSVANREISEQVPCYCGCVGLGHVSLHDCYVSSGPDEALTFDLHAQACTICVDMTQDTMRLMDGGIGVKDIQAYLEVNYAKYGPPTPLQ